MRLCRFDDNRLGIVDGSIVRDVTAALDVVPTQGYPYPMHDVLVEHLDRVLNRARALMPNARTLALDAIRLLSPVANPGKIVAAPVNYEKHRIEATTDPGLHGNNPGSAFNIHSAGLFLKSTSSLVGPGEGVVIRRPDRRTDHEVELVIVIGRKADRVSRADAMAHVAGYAIGLDISIRGSEDRSFRKSPDTYSVLGPWLVTADEIPDPGSLDLQIAVNGEVRQQSNTRLMILGVAELIEMASSMYTLHPGDLIFTGTPEGVSPIHPGDSIVATIAHIGTMAVAVRADRSIDAPAMSTSSAGA
ncbi:MAG TPA: fumarylacetoacetate hydrolase family protein [Vicinamibacterales bacterium]|nr:fumarylacetoacetate hydrolase family protein [Vicinamibacterales bacterium]